MLEILWLAAAVLSPMYLRLLQWRGRRTGHYRNRSYRFCVTGAGVMAFFFFAGLCLKVLGMAIVRDHLTLGAALTVHGHDLYELGASVTPALLLLTWAMTWRWLMPVASR